MRANTMKTNEEHNKRGEEDGLHFRTGYGKVYGLEKMGLTETNCFNSFGMYTLISLTHRHIEKEKALDAVNFGW